MLAGGWVLDTRPMNRISLDSAAGVVRVGAGTTWRELIPVLNAHGCSPKVMQSNHDFSIGGSLSVNCHGWHAGHPPIAATVRGLGFVPVVAISAFATAMASRQNNPLFSAMLAVTLCVMCVLIFVVGLGLIVPLFGPWLQF